MGSAPPAAPAWGEELPGKGFLSGRTSSHLSIGLYVLGKPLRLSTGSPIGSWFPLKTRKQTLDKGPQGVCELGGPRQEAGTVFAGCCSMVQHHRREHGWGGAVRGQGWRGEDRKWGGKESRPPPHTVCGHPSLSRGQSAVFTFNPAILPLETYHKESGDLTEEQSYRVFIPASFRAENTLNKPVSK